MKVKETILQNKKILIILIGSLIGLSLVLTVVLRNKKDVVDQGIDEDVTVADSISDETNKSDGNSSSTAGDDATTSGNDDVELREVAIDIEDPTLWIFDNEVTIDWSVPMPYFNPIGDESLLLRLNYSEFDDLEFDFYDEDLYKRERMVYGPTWFFTHEIEEVEEDPSYSKYIRDLIRYVEGSSGTIEGLTNDGFVFSLLDDEMNHWWGEAELNRDVIKLSVVKENEVKIGDKVVFNTADYEENHIRFTTYNESKEFQSAFLEISAGYLDIEIEQSMYVGTYSRRMDYSKRFKSEIETTYYLDDLPMDTGISYWTLGWADDEDDPKEISLEITSIGDLVDVGYGEDYGAVLISSKYAKTINLVPFGYDDLRLKHPEYNPDSTYLDKTAEGDYLVYVPAGEWRADILPKGKVAVSSYSTGLIPVNAGEITEITIPLAVETAVNKDLDKFLNEQGLKIDKVVDEGDIVKFDFTLVDKVTKSILPSLDNTNIREGGAEVEIIDITTVETPPNVVLVLDSSGSMKGQMDATLEAARSFIKGLPDATHIQVMDFDTTPKLLEGVTKEEAEKALDQIAVGGSTALYDSVILGLDLLQDLERPTLVTFTDGSDENYNGSAPGSEATKEETLEIVAQSGIQLLTIGFGEGHDGATLKELADAGHGHYFSADDQEALSGVFQAINEKINSTYTASYKRPTESAPSDVPVVNIVVDISGSMDSDWNDASGFRMEKMKNLFHKFVMGLPEDTQIQLMAFNESVYIKQIMTSDKIKVLGALGELEAGGGTNISGSVDAGFRTLNAIPSSKKVMVYLTDAALGVDDEQQKNFDYLLGKIKEEEMNVLWIGLGEGLDEADFMHAAELTNGEYIISEDPELLESSTKELLERMAAKKESIKTSIAVQVVKEDENGLITPYSASELVELTPIPLVGKLDLPESVNYVTGKVLKQYDEVSADYLTGDALPKETVKILKRIPLDKTLTNEAASIHLTEMLFLSKLNGVEAPNGQRYVALFAEMGNILPEQEVVVYPDGSGHPANWVGSAQNNGVIKKAKVPYSIPSVFSHFSLSYNNDGMYPLSTATWIANKPLVVPGISSLTLNPDSVEDGAIVFLVPDEAMEQLSLHYYDTNYGHIHMPIVGEMSYESFSIDQLSKTVESKLSDGFSIAVTGIEEIDSIQNMITATANNDFSIIEGRFSSRVQANLSIDPAERVKLEYPTSNGSFLLPLSDVTELVPFGMIKDVLVSPGANNQVSYAFHTPKAISDNSANLFIDLADEDAVIGVSEGAVYDESEPLGFGSHPYARVEVNQLFKSTEDVNGHNASYIIADVTISDIKDGYASRGLINTIKLVQVGHEIEEEAEEGKYEAFDRRLEMALNSGGLGSFASLNYASNQYVLDYSSATKDVILGLDDDTVFYDGESRRGFVLFRPQKGVEYTLKSDFFEGLNAPVTPYAFNYAMLTSKLEFDYDNNFQKELETAINNSINRYKLRNPSEYVAEVPVSDLDETTTDKNDIPAPMIALYGSQVIEGINALEDLEKLIKTLEVKHFNRFEARYPYTYDHSPEAVIAQGWGSVSDMNNLAIKGLAKLGFSPKKRVVELTDIGKEKLGLITNETDTNISVLPALAFDNNGVEEVWVIPFMESTKNLQNSCYYLFDQKVALESRSAKIKIEYLVEPTGKNASDQLNDIGNALGGGSASSGPSWTTTFNQKIPYDVLSMDSIDIGTTITETGHTPRVLTANGVYVGEDGVDVNQYLILGIRLHIDVKGDKMVHTTLLPEGVAIEDLFITAGINLPDLTEKAFDVLISDSDKVYKSADEPDDLSALRWSARRVINQFVAMQSQFESKMAGAYELNHGHITQDSAIVVTQLVDKGSLVTHLDLLNPVTQIIGDDAYLKENKAKIESFNMMAGLNASLLEGQLLDGGYGFKEIWLKRPENSEFIFMDLGGDWDESKDTYEAAGMTETMFDYFESSDHYIIIQEQPSVINGEKRWAWLDVDPDTYETISMLDTLEHGSMVSRAIIEHEKNAANYLFGAMSGINASLWTVCSFSLEIPVYEEMKKAAMGMAYSLKDGTGAKDGKGSWDFGSSSPDVSQNLGPIKIKADASGVSVGENYLGYSNGFAEGVDIYFSRMP